MAMSKCKAVMDSAKVTSLSVRKKSSAESVKTTPQPAK